MKSICHVCDSQRIFVWIKIILQDWYDSWRVVRGGDNVVLRRWWLVHIRNADNNTSLVAEVVLITNGVKADVDSIEASSWSIRNCLVFTDGAGSVPTVRYVNELHWSTALDVIFHGHKSHRHIFKSGGRIVDRNRRNVRALNHIHYQRAIIALGGTWHTSCVGAVYLAIKILVRGKNYLVVIGNRARAAVVWLCDVHDDKVGREIICRDIYYCYFALFRALSIIKDKRVRARWIDGDQDKR
mmetsp:Transcript_21827/g.49442  ORF Transcript_21827/g.49442 Transcript_21827/m.49442 type:complete len:241 (+) Transcript_21827:1062-1784(+)